MQVIPTTDFEHGRMSFLQGVADDRLPEVTAIELERRGLVRIPRAAVAPQLRNQSLPDSRSPGFPPAGGEGTPPASSVPAPPSPTPTAEPFKRGPGRPPKHATS